MLLPSSVTVSIVDNQRRVKSSHTFVPRSFLAQFIACSFVHWSNTSLNIKDINGTDRSTTSSAFTFQAIAGVGVVNKGIVVGSNATAVDIADYKLNTQILHGTGSGQLQYSSSEIVTPYTLDANNAYFELRRTFTNNSPATITIEEIGIYSTLGSSYTCCIERTLNTQDVLVTEGAVITYKFIKTI